MTNQESRIAAREFWYKWHDKGKEDEDARSYWIELLQNILGVDHVTDRIVFEKKVFSKKGHALRIDAYIPETKVLIEQKSINIALDKPQQGHRGLTPYEQAKEYDGFLRHSEKARWIVLSNFKEIWIYNMEDKIPEPKKIFIMELSDKYPLLRFLIDKKKKEITEEMVISLQAGEIVGKLYNAFHKQYINPDDKVTLQNLNKLCVRIVFCLYAEDAGVFEVKGIFHDYMAQFDVRTARNGLKKLFSILNQKFEDRDVYLVEDDPLLAAFPYVNGGLFDDDIEIPPFTEEIMNLLLRRASTDFDWSGISPTIFGAVFESTLNPETRRAGGMHYTSLESIHKVIDPLFLDELKAEFQEIKANPVIKVRNKKLKDLQNKLSTLTFLDPAAGSGNFLTESYICLRKLENEIIKILFSGQMSWGDIINPIRVKISQFYGIEINDFAVTVARTALWIAENQMIKETEDIVHTQIDFLPLKTNAYIVEGNSLRTDWNDVINKYQLNYIMGNPPFRGYALQTKEQKEDMESVWVDQSGKTYKTAGKIDYVSAWYFKAAEYIYRTRIKGAFVSTNSIVQGEQVAFIWKPLKERFGFDISFAWRSFQWESESNSKAAVWVIIVGFSSMPEKNKYIFDGGSKTKAEHINAYLLDDKDVYLENRTNPLCDVPKMVDGSKPVDGGFLIIKEDEYDDFVSHDPNAKPYIKEYIGSDEFINNKKRYCLWLKDAKPKELQAMPLVKKRLEAVKQFRLGSKKELTRRTAETPFLFQQDRQPDSDYIVIPEVSTSDRRYIPIGFMHKDVIASNKIQMMPNASLYHFGILTSAVHMAWVRAVCGRLGMGYDYSIKIVYNNFPWPDATPEQVKKIEKTAKKILDVRASFAESSLAALYDNLSMPPQLSSAHHENNQAVMEAYGLNVRKIEEPECVSFLMELYRNKAKIKV